MAKGKTNWMKVAGKWAKWTVATAGAGVGAAAAQGLDVSDPKVLQQVALTALISGLLGGGMNAAKRRPEAAPAT